MDGMPDPETIPSISYFPFPKEMAKQIILEMRTIAAGLGTHGLADHADKIEAGLNRMGDGMDNAGRSIRAGLIVVGIGLGLGLTVMGAGMILQAVLEDQVRRQRRVMRIRKRRKGGHHRDQRRDSDSGSGDTTVDENVAVAARKDVPPTVG
ncbi:hypothetical protein DFJ77DRAFT_477991 [Powellomyces hirtus]|nr:hypothetical protein DFJ77DRAFT_477991 [Powellomyces hirtus]